MTRANQGPDYLVNLRHDLCTPLSAIIGYSELIIEECHDQGVEELIPDMEKILKESKDLLEFIRRTLDPAQNPTKNPDQLSEIIDAQVDFQIRTSLNSILGLTELALDSIVDEGKLDLIPDLQKLHAAEKQFQSWISSLLGLQLETIKNDSDLGAIAASDTPQLQDAASGQPIGATLRAPGLARGHILVVEDNPVNQDILARYLIRLGHTVTIAEDGQQALKMVERTQYDLVLLDIIMPVMDGYQVLQRLKESITWRDIPVIVISSLDEIDSVVRCIEMGAEDYLPKPFNQVLLTARICACLEKKRLRDQEIEYLRNVQQVTSAAAAVEAGEFELENLKDVSRRDDELGQLARVFQRMTREVYARELQLKQQVLKLRIELDEARQARQVAEITETEYFQKLQARAQELRQIIDST